MKLLDTEFYLKLDGKERVHIALGEAIEKGEPRTARSACRTLISVLVDDDKKVLTNLTSHRVQVLLDDGLLEIIGNCALLKFFRQSSMN